MLRVVNKIIGCQSVQKGCGTNRKQTIAIVANNFVLRVLCSLSRCQLELALLYSRRLLAVR